MGKERKKRSKRKKGANPGYRILRCAESGVRGKGGQERIILFFFLFCLLKERKKRSKKRKEISKPPALRLPPRGVLATSSRAPSSEQLAQGYELRATSSKPLNRRSPRSSGSKILALDAQSALGLKPRATFGCQIALIPPFSESSTGGPDSPEVRYSGNPIQRPWFPSIPPFPGW